MKKKVKRKVALNPNDYVNIHTGEMLNADQNVAMELTTDTIVIKHREFVTLNSDAIDYLSTHLSHADFARFVMMANTLRTEFSICFNNTIPHTSKSLATMFEINDDNLSRLIKRLQLKGLMTYTVAVKSGYLSRVYMINPYVTSKRNSFNSELDLIFDDVTKSVKKRRKSGPNPSKNDGSDLDLNTSDSVD